MAAERRTFPAIRMCSTTRARRKRPSVESRRKRRGVGMRGPVEEVGGWVGGWVEKVEEKEAVRMSYCGLGGWVGGGLTYLVLGRSGP